ncbi:HAMP domain-containing sensor histidine kinase [Actinosynnema sp. ALI-1.44]|uniref:HAMP domain-containing sensor histidine kinase n=1 Tax=Actinosynnema sp. ALI-1.44 TaxID=1933779 RepID=UPI000A0569C6|nr:HAMP domain-containing sensor histidine kinase [Actinosynnema sp. ALI-1.44]
MRRRTIRFRLTALYTSIFLLTSTVLVIAVNLVFSDRLYDQVAQIAPTGQVVHLPLPPGAPRPEPMLSLPDEVLKTQWIVTVITLVVLTVLSIVTGWWIAGRMLRALRRITATAQRLSLSTMDERIALPGPDDELKGLADTIDAMLDRLERSMDSQRRFIANAAHELRTPLATQRIAIQVGLENADDLPGTRAKLLTHNRRTEQLIDSLLVLAEAEHGLDNPRMVDLASLVAQTATESASDGIEMVVNAEPVVVRGDAVLLHRLLVNLVNNAVRYNRPGGEVHIGLTRAGVLTIRNTGPHVPAERIPELFQPFRRLHTRTRSDGAGLGLSIAASIAQAHNAHVTARPNAGGGLELTVVFGIPSTVG